jgi:hypothetical protein
MYFALTTLSTVGLGDLHPVNNFERVAGTVLFMSGIILFSYVLGELRKSLAEEDPEE